MKKIISIHPMFLLVLFFSSCDDNSGGINPCIDCHVNVFKCNINEMDWKPDCIPDPPFGCNSIRVTFDDQANDLEIVASNDHFNNTVRLNARSLVYGIPVKLKSNAGFSDRKINGACNTFEVFLDTLNSSISMYKIDQSKRILGCVFKMKCYNQCGDTVNITNGHFEVIY